MQFFTRSDAETRAFAQKLLDDFGSHRLWCLTGDLGAGKTTFAQGFGVALGIHQRAIKSPTYTYIREHALPRGGVFYHCDLYRIASLGEWDAIGLSDRVQNEDFVLLEWADRLGDAIPARRIDLHFQVVNLLERSITVSVYD